MIEYTTLFLDVDNTLLDFNKAEAHAVYRVLKEHNLPCDEEAIKLYSDINLSFWKRFERGEIERDMIFESRFRVFLEHYNATGDVSAISDRYCANLADEFFTVDGAKELLKYLKDKGYKLYATTNGFAKTQFNRIRGAGLEPFFDKIFISEDARHQKPDKEYFDFVISGIPEKNITKMLIIGDSQSSDILGGINSGIDTCWYNPHGSKAKYQSKYTVTRLSQIKKIL
ncbi:MAG: YjjG family noncanonical pyrimidine nucleotidase [Clostridia bacterium]|nr:YjjG family noncanonical pyrimidine nucleotidase [Clostridia bacterium]